MQVTGNINAFHYFPKKINAFAIFMHFSILHYYTEYHTILLRKIILKKVLFTSTTKWNVQFGTSQQNYVKTKSNLRFPPFYPTSPCRYCERNNTNSSALYWIFHRLLFVWLFVMSQQNWKLCSHTTVLITRIIDLLEKFCLVNIRQSSYFCHFLSWKKEEILDMFPLF